MTSSSSAPTVERNFLRQPAALTAILLTIFAVGSHLYFQLHAGGLWRDEVNLLNLSAHSSLSDLAKDSFPVLMPVLVKFWTALGLGRDDGLLRLLGLTIGLGGVGGLWLAARQAGRSVPLVSLVLFGLNSTVITFGDSLRAYGLGGLMIIYTVAAVWFFLKKPDWWRAGLLTLAAVLSVQTLFHNAVLIGAICAGGVLVGLRRKNWLVTGQIIFAGTVAAISLLPYAANIFAAQKSSVVLRTGFSWGRFWDDVMIDFGFPHQPYLYVWVFLALFVVGLGIKSWFVKPALVAAPESTLSVIEMRLFAGATLLLATIGFLLFLWFTAMPGQPWYFLPLMALAAVCLDTALSTLPKLARQGILAGAIITALLALPVAKRDLNYRFTNLDAWAQALQATAKPEDFIVIVPWFCGITLDHYFKGSTPWNTIPPMTDHTTHRYDLVREQLQRTNVMQPVLAKLRATLQAGHRVWLLAPRGALQIPVSGNPPPADLPLAPLPKTGWADEPYAVVWAGQAMQCLSTYSCEFRLVSNPDASPQIAENLELFLAEGCLPLTGGTNSHAQ